MGVKVVSQCKMVVLRKLVQQAWLRNPENRTVSTEVEHLFLNTFGHGPKQDNMQCMSDAKLNNDSVGTSGGFKK